MGMKQMLLTPARLTLLAFVLTGLCACADEPEGHYYHPRRHTGQGAPDWYRPPATPAGSIIHDKSLNSMQRQPGSNPQALQYDR